MNTGEEIERLKKLNVEPLSENTALAIEGIVARSVGLSDAVAVIADLQKRLELVHGTLTPLEEQDWHGKWRIHRALLATDLSVTPDDQFVRCHVRDYAIPASVRTDKF